LPLKKETTFDLSGCCVLRDIFGFHAECKSYRVKRFLQANSPVSMVSPSVCDIGLRSVTYDDCVAKSDFLKHSTAADFNKTAFIEFRESHADWLMLDISELSYGLLYIWNPAAKKGTYVTHSVETRNSIPQMKQSGLLEGCKWEYKDILSWKESDLKQYIYKYLSQLKCLYPCDRIILTEVVNALDFMKDEKMESYKNQDWLRQVNQLLRKCLEWARELLPDSYVIYMPDGVYGDSEHKWKLGPRHYDSKYYDYGLEAVNVIVSEDIADKRERLRELHQMYSLRYLSERKRWM